jgi:UDP-glucuronate decarboxylase
MTRLRFSSATEERLVESGLEVVVTGGGGWLGQATLEMLESSLGAQVVTRVHAFASSARTLRLRSGTEMMVSALRDLPLLRAQPRLVAHYAFGTREHVSRIGIAEYIARNEEITRLVASHVSRTRPVGALVMSSGAVYFGDQLVDNPYGVLKARDEDLFFDIAASLGTNATTPRVVVPRLFNLAGPFLNKPEYVLGSIVRDIANGGPIRLHADHPVVRSYVHVRDLIDLCFSMMLGDSPIPEKAFDTAGEREIEVGELAELSASVLGCSGMPIRRPPVDDSRVDRYVGDPTMIDFLARSYGIEFTTLVHQIEDTAEDAGN